MVRSLTALSFAIVLATVTSVTIGLSSSSMAAGAGACAELFKIRLTKAQAEAYADEVFAMRATGLGNRGLISAKYGPDDPEVSAAMQARGMMWWATRVYIAPTMELAIRHAKGEPDPSMQGTYFIDPSFHYLDEANPRRNQLFALEAGDAFITLSKTSPLYIINDGKPEVVPFEFIHERFALTPDRTDWQKVDPEHGPFMAIGGWAFPKLRGIIQHANTLDSGTYRNLHGLGRNLEAKGWKFPINRDPERSLRMVRAQGRFIKPKYYGETMKDQSGKDIPGSWVRNSRFRHSKELFDGTLAGFKTGKVFSVEAWDAEGSLVAGLIVAVDGALFSPETLFYNYAKYPQYKIDLANVLFVMLIDQLAKAGVTTIDVGMVSPNTAKLKGELISGDAFQAFLKGLPQDVTIALPDTLHPRPGQDPNAESRRNKPKQP